MIFVYNKQAKYPFSTLYSIFWWYALKLVFWGPIQNASTNARHILKLTSARCIQMYKTLSDWFFLFTNAETAPGYLLQYHADLNPFIHFAAKALVQTLLIRIEWSSSMFSFQVQGSHLTQGKQTVLYRFRSLVLIAQSSSYFTILSVFKTNFNCYNLTFTSNLMFSVINSIRLFFFNEKGSSPIPVSS